MLWSAWYPYVLPELPGAPEVLINHVLIQVTNTFFTEAQVWTADITPINIVANTGTYTLAVPAQTITAAPLLTEIPDVTMVKWVWVDGQQIYPASMEELGALHTYWADKTASVVSNYTQLTQDTITLYPIPTLSSTAGLKAKVAIAPSLTATGLPDWLGSKYVQEIASGVKATMMGMVGKPWSNAEGEVKYGKAFASALTKATVDANKSFTRTVSTVRFPRYG